MSKAKTPKSKAAALANKAKKLVAEEKKAADSAAAAEKLKSENDGSSSDQNGLADSSGSSSDQNGLGEGSGSGSDQNGLSDKSPAKKIAIVIPYLKAKAQGSELLLAIRSIAKNLLQDDFQLVVIGDKEDWFSEEIVFIDKPCFNLNPQADVIDKMKTILLDETISDEFIWTNDDIYFIASTFVDEIKIPKTMGHLVDEPGNAGLYNQNRARTISALQRIGMPIRNFDTHMPFYFEKEKMMEVFEAFPSMLEQGLLLASAYFNLHLEESDPAERLNWRSDNWMLRVISDLKSEEKKSLFRNLINKKRFLNHSEAGYSKLLTDWLFRRFPEKCRFEK